MQLGRYGIVALGLVARLIAARRELFYNDIDQFQHWTNVLVSSGPARFYETAGAIDYPPGLLYVLWLYGRWHALLGGSVPPSDFAMRLVPIAAEVCLAFVAGAICRTNRARLAATALVALNPAFLLDSAVFGQVEALALIPVLGAAWAVTTGHRAGDVTAAALLVVGVATKPHVALFAIPLGLVLLHRAVKARDPTLLVRIAGIAATAAGVGLLVLAPFQLEARSFAWLVLLGRSRHDYVSSFAMNPWGLQGWMHTGDARDAITGVVAMALVTAAVSWFTWRALRRGADEFDVLLLSAAALTLGAWVVMTGMHERYLVFGLGYLVPVVIARRLAIVVSAFAALNLLYTYWWFRTWMRQDVVRVGLLEATLFRDGAVRALCVASVLLIPASILLLRRVHGTFTPAG